MQGPAGSTGVRQPRDLNRGHLRTPAPGKLRLTRRAWLLLWLTATLIAVVDGGLLLRGASVTVMVEGRSTPVPAGLTTGQVLGRLGAAGMAGDLLAVDHSVLRKGAYPPRLLINGQPASATRRLGRGDRVTVARGRTRIEPVARVTQQLAAGRPGNPIHSLATGPAQAILDRGRLSGRMVPVAFHPAAGSPGPLPVALTFDDGPWPNSTAQILAILVQRQAPATFFVVGRQVQRHPELVHRELAAGMVVGNHSYEHLQPFDRLPAARVRDEIGRGRRTLQAVGYARWASGRRAGPPRRPSWQPSGGWGSALCCGVSTRPTGSPASPPSSSRGGCWPRSGRGRLCCCTTVAGIGRPPWPPCRPSSMGCAAWASP
jgi:peptidoglycan/xylan/chitin deacetylase (PgdA/CDA1 family)